MLLLLSKGYRALVDDDDPKEPWKYKWTAEEKRHPNGKLRTVYAYKHIVKKGKRTTQYLHRFLLDVSDPKVEVDHEDSNGLNNGRKNLRRASRQQQSRNSSKCKGTSSRYKGVYKRRDCKGWVAQTKVFGRKVHIGSFSSEELARNAYDSYVISNYGEFARPNERTTC